MCKRIIDAIAVAVAFAIGLVGGVSLSTGQSCPADVNRDQQVTVDEIVLGINAALTGCPPVSPRDLTGEWRGTAFSDFTPGSIALAVTFTQDGLSVAGSLEATSECLSSGLIGGLHSNENGVFTGVVAGSNTRVFLEGVSQGRRLDGAYVVLVGGDCTGDQGNFSLLRSP